MRRRMAACDGYIMGGDRVFGVQGLGFRAKVKLG